MHSGQKVHLFGERALQISLVKLGYGVGGHSVGSGKGCPNLLPPESVLEEPQQSADLCHWLVEEDVKSRTLFPVALLGHLRDGVSWSARPSAVRPVNVCPELPAPGTVLRALQALTYSILC